MALLHSAAPGDRIKIGEDVVITVRHKSGRKTLLSVDAPRSISVEILRRPHPEREDGE